MLATNQEPARDPAVIYARVSTDKQETHGVSLDMQVARCLEYAEARGLDVIDTVVETESAKSIQGRFGLQRILTLAKLREIKHIITWKTDRAFRNTVESLQTVALLKRCGVDLHRVDKGRVETESADDEFLFTLEAGLATRERRMVSERTRAALRRKKERGEALGGAPPYGYQFRYELRRGKKVKVLEENGEEQFIIRYMRELRSRGISIQNIIKKLEYDGYKSRTGNKFRTELVHELTFDSCPEITRLRHARRMHLK